MSSHFTLKLHDTFNAGLPAYRWGKYDGWPSSTSYSRWAPSHVTASGGVAMLRGYRDGSGYATGGMMLNSVAQTYGKYVVRARFDRSSTVQHAMMLWPVDGWPPEVDFSEGPTTQGVMASAHWGSSNSQEHAFLRIDMTQWHTYGVEWTPTRLVYTVDGRAWAVMTGAAVPHQAMKLAIQTVATSQPSSATTSVNLALADVYVWSYH
ncbi:MAG: exsH [Frankiales bacterium]|nr:exsH [Frankiales bacterium]